MESNVSSPDSEGKKATMEAHEFYANGKRDREDSPESGEMDPCLPGSKKPTQSHDEIDHAPLKVNKSTKVNSSNNSVNKKRDSKRRLVDRVESRVRDKTGLTRVGLVVAGLVLLLLLVFLIVIIVLGATWPRTPHSQLFPVCSRAACLQASAEMLPKMNSSAVPCDDFWNYACGGWLKAHSSPPESRSKWSQEEEAVFKSRDHIRSLVSTLPHPTKDSSIEWKVKRLYESCMALDTIESDNYTPLRKIIHQLGGWHALREFSILSWDYRTTLQVLQATYGVSPFFKISVVPDPRNTTRSMIQLSPAGLGLPGRSYYYRSSNSPFPGSTSQRVCLDLSNVSSLQALYRLIAERNAVTAYKRFLRDAVQLMGATSPGAKSFSDDTFHFEKRIAEITPDPAELQNPLNHSIVTVGQLKTQAPSIPLHEILLAMFPRANIAQTTELLLPSEKYINRVSTILSTTDRTALNNYMMWVLASNYLPYMSEEIRATVNYYRKEMTGAMLPFERWEVCVETLQRFMGFALVTLQQQAMQEKERHAAKEVVNEMFGLIRSAARKRIEEADWMDLELKSHELDKMDALDLQVGLSSHLLDKEYLERFYSKLLVQRNDFFQNILYGVEFLREVQQERLTSPAPEHRWMDIMCDARSPVYVPAANLVVVPLQFLKPPLFHPEFPLSVLYGGLGVELASALVSSVQPWSVYYEADGRLLSVNNIAAKQSLVTHERPIKFLVKQLVNAEQVSEVVANRTVVNTMSHISALRQALSAMQAALEELPHTHQPAMETLESDAIFFLTHAQTLCSVSTLQEEDHHRTISFRLEGAKLLRASLKQIQRFTDAFSCAPESSYNAENVCRQIL